MTKAITVDSIFTNSLEKRPLSMTLDEAKSTVFDTETYKMLVLDDLMANNLPLAHTNSPVLAVLLAYAKRCDSVDLPTVNRQFMRTALDIVYLESVDEFKSEYANHTPRYIRVVWANCNLFDIVNSQDTDDKRKRKRFEAQVEQRSMSTSGTECADTSSLQNATVLREMGEGFLVSVVRRTWRTRAKENFMDNTQDSPEFGDSDVSDAETLASRHNLESCDAETLNSSRGLELIDFGCTDSRLREAPRLDFDSGCSDSSEDEDSD